ncbi:MAG: metal-dependent hydrolase [Candidatus Lambdaproteobacteria bacterium]|nr:metal-dependent hydrolase [Candidatus Lambdaproteobacteria bacterium]
MFIGHYAVAFAGRSLAPRPSLGTWVLAAQALDLLWPVLVLSGVERVRIDPGNTAFTPLDFEHYPWSHSLLMSAVWAVLVGAGYGLLRRDGRAALLLGLGVLSHWVLDWASHGPDLPLWPGGASVPLGQSRVGLGLWHSVPATVLVEGVLFALGVWLYVRATRLEPGDRLDWRLASLVLVLAAIYVANLLAPPPPAPGAVAVAGLGLWLFVAWAYWVDRRRTGPSGEAAAAVTAGGPA